MRSVFLLLAFVALASAATPLLSEDEYQVLFSAYMKDHNKEYSSPAEMFSRYNTFKQNFDLVHIHNEEAAQGKHTFTLAMNQFADITNEEYRQRLGLKRDGKTAEEHHSKHGMHCHHTFVGEAASTLPASFDWRDQNAVGAVKNQGSCGSCWAFSATAALEFAYFNKTKSLASFSEQLCVDCAKNGADTCDVGGEMSDCYVAVQQLGAEESEDNYPYTQTSGAGCRFDNKSAFPNFKVSGYKNVTQGDEAALQVAAYEAVLAIAIDASSIFFQLYSKGVYSPLMCKNQWNQLDHGVAIVGWGTDATGGDYWIVRNSWGASWGQQGYIWMARNKNNQCGVATDASFPIYG